MTAPPASLTAALAERYTIERELGAGGMATVYLAHDLKHDRDVAIKVLHSDLAATIGVDRFLSEIKVTANLQHPNILGLFDSGIADGQAYYVMPYVEGETLRDRLTREKQLPVADALRIATGVAAALEYAHAHGVIHRDIKPENILLESGQPVVADFGIALAVQQAGGQRLTQTGMTLGTPRYMSPEQAMGERTLDARTDIYALGVVAYEMLAGDAPFTGSSAQAIVAKVLTERPSPITTVRDTVPAGVEYAVLRALAKLPADRWATAAEFASALRLDAPTGAIRHTTSPGSRGPWPRISLALGIISLGLLVVVTWTLTRQTTSSLPAMFDAALPDTALMSSAPDLVTGFGAPMVNLSIAPSGDFVVYSVRHGDSTRLWSRSLLDASAHPIAGTAGGTTPRISPDGTRIAFAASGRTMIVPIQGGEPRRLPQGDSPVSTLDWVSPTRVLAITNDGSVLYWLDPEGSAAGQKLTLAVRCPLARWITSGERLLCTRGQGDLRNLQSNTSTTIRVRNADGSPGAIVLGDGFRIVDDRYLLYLSADGDLRAAPYDKETDLVGRSVSLVSGIKIDATGSAQLDLAPNGMLGFVSGASNADVQMVLLRPGSDPKPLPIERARFQRFDVTRDGRRLVVVVITAEGQELRIYDLRTGQRRTWLRAQWIGYPLWDTHGDRVLVRIRNSAGAAILFGSPNSATAPDTLFSAADPTRVPEPTDYRDDQDVLMRSANAPFLAYRTDLAKRPLRFDTLLTDASFMAISPDRKHMVWQSLQTGEFNLASYPPGPQRELIAAGGIEGVWLSPTEVLYRTGVVWSVARLNPATGQLAGRPTRWGFDPRFLDTPGWSNRLSGDGGIVYVQSPDVSDARFLRFIPNFVARMKAAVDQANR